MEHHLDFIGYEAPGGQAGVDNSRVTSYAHTPNKYDSCSADSARSSSTQPTSSMPAHTDTRAITARRLLDELCTALEASHRRAQAFEATLGLPTQTTGSLKDYGTAAAREWTARYPPGFPSRGTSDFDTATLNLVASALHMRIAIEHDDGIEVDKLLRKHRCPELDRLALRTQLSWSIKGGSEGLGDANVDIRRGHAAGLLAVLDSVDAGIWHCVGRANIRSLSNEARIALQELMVSSTPSHHFDPLQIASPPIDLSLTAQQAPSNPGEYGGLDLATLASLLTAEDITNLSCMMDDGLSGTSLDVCLY